MSEQLEQLARDTAERVQHRVLDCQQAGYVVPTVFLSQIILTCLTTATADLRREVEHLKDCKGTCGLECLNCAQDSARQGLVYYKEAKAENDRLKAEFNRHLRCPECNHAMIPEDCPALAENDRLRKLLRVAHDAMHSWYSSEYANHPLSQQVAAALKPAQ